MPFGLPLAASGCARTALPRLMAARSFPVGARSFSTSGDAALWAKAEAVAARNTEAAQMSVFMAFFPLARLFSGTGVPLRALPNRDRDPAAVRKPAKREAVSPHA